MAAPQDTFVLFARGTRWQVVVSAGTAGTNSAAPLTYEAPPNALPETVADALAAMLRDNGYAGQGVMLALPSEWCLVASIEASDIPRKGRRQALLYRLEERLPVAAEDVVADFSTAAAEGATVLGACVQVQQVRPLVAALEAAGVSVQSISPAATLAIQGLPPEAMQDVSLMLWQETDQAVNVMSLRDGRLSGWQVAAADAADIAARLRVYAMDASATGQVWASLAPELLSAVRAASTEVEIDQAADVSMTASAVAGARQVLGGAASLVFEFRRDALAIDDPLRQVRGALNVTMMAGLVLLLCLAGVFFVRAGRYAEQADALQRRQKDVYREQFPTGAVPESVKLRLQSQWRSLAGQTGGNTAAVPRTSALVAMHRVLANLPRELRFTIETMDFQETSFVLTGRAPSYEAAGALAAAIRANGLEVPDPQASKLSQQEWSYTILGRVKAASPPPKVAAAQGSEAAPPERPEPQEASVTGDSASGS